jgi:hypothetical protein
MAAELRAALKGQVSAGVFGWVVQALSEFGRVDDALRWINATPTEVAASGSYVFFRPGGALLRRDPRFMLVAKRAGLLDYWRSSGKWPDFCNDPQLPYDCKAEAGKHG